MKLNCDLGESYGRWQMGDDLNIMPYIDMANVACSYHAGDPTVMQKTIALAKQHGVRVGAHPSYPDLQGFGRRSMKIGAADLIPLLHYQIAALHGMAKCQHVDVEYVKPHGALYNDMMSDQSVYESVLQAVSSYHAPLTLIIQATSDWQQHQRMAAKHRVSLMAEVFADRRYTDDGRLLPRTEPGAVLEHEQLLEQVHLLLSAGKVVTATGKELALQGDTLCVHGDNAEALAAAKEIRTLISA